MNPHGIFMRKQDGLTLPNQQRVASQPPPKSDTPSKVQETSQKPLISILNYDEDQPATNIDFLTSPFSKEACNRLGIIQKELLAKKIEEFQKDVVPEEFKDDPALYHNIRFENYEYNRQQLIKSVIEERVFLMNNPKLMRSLSASKSSKKLYKYPLYWGFKGQEGLDLMKQQELSEHINSAKNKPLNDSGVQSSAERKRIEKEQRIADMKNLAEARKLREAKERENDKLHQLIGNQQRIRDHEERKRRDLEDQRLKRNKQLEVIEEKIKKESKQRRAMSDRRRKKYDELQQAYLVLRQQRDNENLERYLQREEEEERKKLDRQQQFDSMLQLKRYKQLEKQRRVHELKVLWGELSGYLLQLQRQREREEYQEYLRQKQMNTAKRIEDLYHDRKDRINQKLRDQQKRLQQASAHSSSISFQIQTNLDDAEYLRLQRNLDVLNKLKQNTQEADDRKLQWVTQIYFPTDKLLEQRKKLIYEHLKEDDAKDRLDRLRRANAYKQKQFYDQDDSRDLSQYQSFYLDPNSRSPSKGLLMSSRIDSASGTKRMPSKKNQRNFRSYTQTPAGEFDPNSSAKTVAPRKQFAIRQPSYGSHPSRKPYNNNQTSGFLDDSNYSPDNAKSARLPSNSNSKSNYPQEGSIMNFPNSNSKGSNHPNQNPLRNGNQNPNNRSLGGTDSPSDNFLGTSMNGPGPYQNKQNPSSYSNNPQGNLSSGRMPANDSDQRKNGYASGNDPSANNLNDGSQKKGASPNTQGNSGSNGPGNGRNAGQDDNVSGSSQKPGASIQGKNGVGQLNGNNGGQQGGNNGGQQGGNNNSGQQGGNNGGKQGSNIGGYQGGNNGSSQGGNNNGGQQGGNNGGQQGSNIGGQQGGNNNGSQQGGNTGGQQGGKNANGQENSRNGNSDGLPGNNNNGLNSGIGSEKSGVPQGKKGGNNQDGNSNQSGPNNNGINAGQQKSGVNNQQGKNGGNNLNGQSNPDNPANYGGNNNGLNGGYQNIPDQRRNGEGDPNRGQQQQAYDPRKAYQNPNLFGPPIKKKDGRNTNQNQNQGNQGENAEFFAGMMGDLIQTDQYLDQIEELTFDYFNKLYSSFQNYLLDKNMSDAGTMNIYDFNQQYVDELIKHNYAETMKVQRSVNAYGLYR